MIRVILPEQLRTLAGTEREIKLNINGQVTLDAVITALENLYPMLNGTIRDQETKQRRPFLRFFACEQDFSHEKHSTVLPGPVLSGAEAFFIIGAIAGG